MAASVTSRLKRMVSSWGIARISHPGVAITADNTLEMPIQKKALHHHIFTSFVNKIYTWLLITALSLAGYDHSHNLISNEYFHLLDKDEDKSTILHFGRCSILDGFALILIEHTCDH